MIQIEGLKIAFDTVVLNASDIRIPENRITLIKGASGSGKTSLLYRIGLVSSDKGFRYLVDGEDLMSWDEKKKASFRGSRLSFVLQDNSMFEQYDVLGNLKLYASFGHKRYSEEEYKKILRSVRLRVPFNQPVQTLSGGERQRLAIACCLCKDTPIILMDEPTSFLDEQNEKTVFSVMQSIAHEYGKTIIFSSHSSAAQDIADEIYEIKNRELHETRHCEDVACLPRKHRISSEKLSWLSYSLFFHKKFRKLENTIVLVITTIIIMVTGLSIYSTHSTAKSIHAFEELCENQLFVTKDARAATVNNDLDAFSFSEEDAYPFVRTYAVIEGRTYPALPLFKQNDISPYISYKLQGNGVYLSETLYQDLIQAHVNPADLSVHLIAQSPSGLIECQEVFVPEIILSSAYKCYYLSDPSLPCALVDHEILDRFYKECGAYESDQYIGYTIFANSFEEYRETVLRLRESHGVQGFFAYGKEVEQLTLSAKRMHRIIGISGHLLAITATAMLEMMYFHKRNKETMLLKLNGVANAQILGILLLNMALRLFVVFALSGIFAAGACHAFQIPLSSYIATNLLILCCITLIEAFLMFWHIKNISIESVIREQEQAKLNA